MKRFLSILTVFAMLTATLLGTVLFVAADGEGDPTPESPAPSYRVPAAGLYDENLIAYYNFLGETAEEQLADKAPAGQTDDVMSATEGVTVTDGVATIPSTQAEFLSLESFEGDLASLAGKTIYLEFKATGAATQYANDIISANGTFRYWLNKNSTTDNYTFGGGITSKPTTTGNKLTANGDLPSNPATEWYYIAITFELTENDLTINIYNSDDGTDYVPTTTVFAGDYKPENLDRSDAILFGKATKTVGDRGFSLDINQFRVYDKVLTAAEIRNLSYITPGQATTEVAPEGGTTPDTPDTPATPEENPYRVPVAGLYDENLVAYYNFDGETDAEKAADKAPAGLKNDTLALSDVIANNGVAFISSAKGSYMALLKGGDAADLAGKTIYLTFNATGSASQYSADLICAYGQVRYWLNKGSGDDNFQFGGGINSTPTQAGYKLSTNKEAPTKPAGDWYYVALTFEMTENDLTITAYNSADGTNYVTTIDKFSKEVMPETLVRGRDLLIGKSGTTTADRGISFYIDELRIYDKVLTAEEVANLSYITPGQATTLPEPGEPGGDQPGGDQPGGDQPGGDQPGGDQPGGDQPGGDQPGGDQPGGDQPGNNDQVTEPSVTEPATTPTETPTTEAPTTTEPSTDNGSSDTEKKGCGASVAALPLALLLLCSTAGVTVLRKKD